MSVPRAIVERRLVNEHIRATRAAKYRGKQRVDLIKFREEWIKAQEEVGVQVVNFEDE